MANLCSNYIEITGNKKDIASLGKKIEEQDTELLSLFYWFTLRNGNDYGMWEDTLAVDSDSIFFGFGSKYAPPLKAIESLAEKYPRLNFNGSYEESGCEVYGKFYGTEGEFTFTDMAPLEYFTEFNEDFAAEREFIEKSSYEDFLKHALEEETNDLDYLWTYLDPLIIDRIKEKDLPLFIDREWYNEDDAEKFTEKLKGK